MLNMQYNHKTYIITSFENLKNYEDIIIKRSVALAVQLNQLIYGYKNREIFTYEHVLNHILEFMKYINAEYKFSPPVIKIKEEFNKAKEIDFVNYNSKINAYYPILKNNEIDYNTRMIKMGYVKYIVNNEQCLKNSKNYSIQEVFLALNKNELSLKAYQRYMYKNQNNELYHFNFNLTKNKYIKRYLNMTDIEKSLIEVNKPTLLINKDDLVNLSPKNCRVEGYILAKSNLILDTIKNISSCKSARVVIDKNLLYSEMNDEFKNYGILFLVEGSRDFKVIIKKEINSDNYEIKNINELLDEEILSLKRGIFKKYLWKKENIVNWVIKNDIGLSVDLINELSEDWINFKKEILFPDSNSFFESCNLDDKNNAIEDLKNRSNILIQKYKAEILKSIFNIWHQYTIVNILNPTIVEIYANQKYSSMLTKNYPKLNINYLSDKAFKEFALN